MKKEKKRTFILLALLFVTTFMYAIPAIPDPVVFTQPDGQTLTVMIKGDERLNWYETMDGYTLLFNLEGFLTYAQWDEDGNLQPTDIIATDIEKREDFVSSFLHSINKKMFFSDLQKDLMLQVWEIEDDVASKKTKAVTGQYKTMCAFVQFPEKSFIKSMSDFEGLMNQLGYTAGGAVGSVRDFFKESSYDQFDLIITLCGIYTAPQSESYYAGSGGSQNCRALASWTAQQVAAEPDIDFRDYDSNSDGDVDGFHFIFAGRGQEAGGGSSTIWSHKWQIQNSQSVYQNGVRISVYSCSPELLYANITTVGVICHEMTHAFGEPDFYDTDGTTGGSYDGTGTWDIMASGSWNGSPGGNCPPHHTMYTKIQFGWVTPIVLDSPITITDMPNVAENPVAYRVNTATANEYYLLENRQRIKFDANIPGNGLLIYHVHSNVGSNCVNCTHPQRLYPVCANRTTQMPTNTPSSYGNISSTGTPFPGSSNKTSFTDDTTPAMKSWANANTGKPITNITHANRLISFDFMGGGTGTTYTITASSGENGTIYPSGETTVFEGGTQTYSITPNTHYARETVLINGVNNTTAVTTGGYTFTNVNSNQTIEATFIPKTYTVTFNANSGNGNMNPQNFTYGIEQKLLPNTFINPDFIFQNWNTQANGSGTSYANEESISLTANITLYAQWKSSLLVEYTITATSTEGGVISPEGEITVLEGEAQLFTITPHVIVKEGNYEIADVLVDGISVGAVECHLFEDVTTNHTIHALFKLIEGIDDLSANQHSLIRIIPNPANDYIELQVTSNKPTVKRVEFYNAFGQLVKIVPFDAQIQNNVFIQKISISDLSKGIYVVKVESNTTTLVVH